MVSLGGVDWADDLLGSHSGFKRGGDIANLPIIFRVCGFGRGGVPDTSDLCESPLVRREEFCMIFFFGLVATDDRRREREIARTREEV